MQKRVKIANEKKIQLQQYKFALTLLDGKFSAAFDAAAIDVIIGQCDTGLMTSHPQNMHILPTATTVTLSIVRQSWSILAT